MSQMKDAETTGFTVKDCFFWTNDTPAERQRYLKWLDALPPEARDWRAKQPPPWAFTTPATAPR